MFLLKWLVKILEIILVSTIVYINQDFLQTIFILRILVHVLYRFFNDEYSTSGASSGIGAATALEFAKNGAKLVLAARNVERLNEVASQCSSKGLQQEKVSNNMYQNITKMHRKRQRRVSACMHFATMTHHISQHIVWFLHGLCFHCNNPTFIFCMDSHKKHFMSNETRAYHLKEIHVYCFCNF